MILPIDFPVTSARRLIFS